MRISGEHVELAMKTAGITRVDHHDCGACGAMTFYSRDGDRLFFHSACDCSWSPPRESSFNQAAEWINMQTNEGTREKLMVAFGWVADPQQVTRDAP